MIKKSNDPNEKERSLFSDQEKRFKRFVLQPHTAYFIPPGTSYTLITCQKSLFSIQRVHDHVYFKNQHKFNPIKDTEIKGLLRTIQGYGEIPATPAVDHFMPLSDDEELSTYVPNAEDFFRRPPEATIVRRPQEQEIFTFSDQQQPPDSPRQLDLPFRLPDPPQQLDLPFRLPDPPSPQLPDLPIRFPTPPQMSDSPLPDPPPQMSSRQLPNIEPISPPDRLPEHLQQLPPRQLPNIEPISPPDRLPEPHKCLPGN
ncbi:hypothetical protein TNIN_179401 [Trichonephila inaurata madagascariensis]|uniref:Uncharacterized protein n=1 Tax=Trichonephila inaurata madagascariensis TaxID=2747483 RepID=A0A8X6Y6C1_9ARAC|nr:hypothetical protein TNIN_179401 [Trichonephila inaurata madagascariensis]